MSPTLTACRSGLSVAAAVVLLTACGGSDDETSASSSSSESSSSSSETSTKASDSEFCTQAGGIEDRVNTSFDQSDPAALGQTLRQVAGEVKAIEPPAEIADDWNTLAAAVEQIATALESTDLNDPAAQQSVGAQLGQLQTELEASATNVENYLASECGIETDSTETAAPTS
jgi:hypothetical protein